MKLDDLNVYKESMVIGEEVWNLVNKWDYFAKDTVGKQLVRQLGVHVQVIQLEWYSIGESTSS